MSNPVEVIVNNNTTTPRQRGLTGSITSALPPKTWTIVGIILVILLAVAAFSTYQYYTNFKNDNCPDSSGLIDVGFCAFEDRTGVEDTGDSTSQAFLSNLLWASPFGYLGAAIGIRTEGDTVGERVGNNFSRISNNTWTLFRRLTGR